MKLLKNQMETNAKTKLTLALCTVLALSVSSLRAQQDDNGKDKNIGAPGATSTTEAGKAGTLSRGDEKFVKDACKGGQMEVQMGKLGVQKAQDTQVKQFAQTLIDDHTKANTELKALAERKGCTLPEAHDRITSTTEEADRTQVREKADAEHGELKKLEGLSGTEFDRQFVRMAVKDHEKDVKEFEKASQNLDDAELKSFATKTLPTLQAHLQTAKSLQSQVSGAGAPGAESGTQTDQSATPDKSPAGKQQL